MYLKAWLDASCRPSAWLQRSVFPPYGSMNNPANRYGSNDELSMGFLDTPSTF